MRRLMLVAGALVALAGTRSAARASELPLMEDGSGCGGLAGQVCHIVSTETCTEWEIRDAGVTITDRSGGGSITLVCKTKVTRTQTYYWNK